ncbi:hypothetical protein O6H91_07G053200 [Diphasiastrum complanatum]|uniref:Uncharacterized protein n=6 Tax=Diphasiastrum complanatum TaxID=34168 RepID=A0ACC2D586_DIPCM|nr:hypothetical protein O6H91_07G053200 [Diphasiastrum complanatum]KAJ7549440.1 hypothetical protein O6H91_07G053200 [Diphasiastrum complanatum]KAJ7549441.1 hypothetical protein O6H91_07G053200 [Diphasiastrum complanatum]KAJ7549445.1 hypothetical protein O6H91_07G053200 [Diphasiastrum complanatum]
MEYLGTLWKRNFNSSPRGNSSPKASLGSSREMGIKDRNNSGRINKSSPAHNMDASREDLFYRGASAMDSIQNSPKHENIGAPEGKYDDVFGGPPKYVFSKYSLQAPAPDYDEAFLTRAKLSPAWKDSDFPVFGSPLHDNEAFGSVSGKQAILEDVYGGRLIHVPGVQDDPRVVGAPCIRSRISSRSNSCVQSPLRPESSFGKDRMQEELLIASVSLGTDSQDVQPSREAEKVAFRPGTKNIFVGGPIPVQDQHHYNELIPSKGQRAEDKRTHQRTPSKSKNKSCNDYPGFDRSSEPIIPDEANSTVPHLNEDSNEGLSIEADTVSVKKLPRVSQAPLHPASSPRWKNQRSFLRRKFGMAPPEDLSTQAYLPAQLAKESSASPSSSLQSTSAKSRTVSKADSLDKLENRIPGQHISGSPRAHLEVLDNNIVKNRIAKQKSKDFDLFASAVAAIKNAESKFKLANPAREKEKQEFVAGEDNVERATSVFEKEVQLREKSCSEDRDDAMGSSWRVLKTAENLKDVSAFKTQARERQERETRFSHDVLEREEVEALVAVERERKLREQRQKHREKQEITQSPKKVTEEAEERAALKTREIFTRVAAEQFERRMAEQKERPLAEEKSIADRFSAKYLGATTLARAEVVAVKRVQVETLQKPLKEITVIETTLGINSVETGEEIQAVPRDQQRRNQSDLKQTTFNSNSVGKGEENDTAVFGAEYISARKVADDWLPTTDSQAVEEGAAAEKSACSELHQHTLERVARALKEKNQRDLEIQQDQAEKHWLADSLDGEIRRWSSGKEGNIRALLSTLQYVLWPECGWQPVYLTDIISPVSVKKVYRTAALFVHPDKMQQKGASLQQKYIAEKVFFLLKVFTLKLWGCRMHGTHSTLRSLLDTGVNFLEYLQTLGFLHTISSQLLKRGRLQLSDTVAAYVDFNLAGLTSSIIRSEEGNAEHLDANKFTGLQKKLHCRLPCI